ncbi:MAG: PriCT-2 domain-containing protein [Solobacterium sp.]|nr:PriCT-2 domain-containing protein [Solobacterium sp.]
MGWDIDKSGQWLIDSKAKEEIVDALYTIKDTTYYEYDPWIQIGEAIKLAGLSWDIWDQWSQQDPRSDRYDPSIILRKWNSFKRGSVSTIFKYAEECGYRASRDAEESGVINDKPFSNEESLNQFYDQLLLMFDQGDNVNIVTKAMKKIKEDGTVKWIPTGYGITKPRDAWLHLVRDARKADKGIEAVIGNYNKESGAWLRMNPTDGQGVGDVNITAYRYMLLESDDMSLYEQRQFVEKHPGLAKLLIHSGGKSLHMVVYVNASNIAQYRDRFAKTIEICNEMQFTADKGTRNPSRLMRLAGVMRNGKRQEIQYRNIRADWRRWYEQIRKPQLFHFVDADGKAKGVFDYGIFEYLKQNEHLFILGKIPYIYRDGFYQQDTTGAGIKTMIRDLILPQFARAPTVDRVYNLFLSDADLQKKTEDVNCFPDHWMNFKNGFYDPIEKKMIPHDPKYLAIYQLSCEYHPDKEYEGDQLEDWLQFICSDPGDREMLLQFCGYSLTRDIRQQKFLLLNGAGGTGKSTLISLIETMVGSENNSHVSLTKFNVKFANFALLGKVLNTCGDEDITVLKDTQVLKQVSGEDPIQVESKGKDPIDYHVYAKCIFSTNNLPVILNEDTNGFYRRILLLKMNRTPEKQDPWLSEKLKKELPYFIHLCVKAAERLYENGLIKESDNSIEAVKVLRCESDTVQAWLEKECRIVKKNMYHPTPMKLLENYEAFCDENDRTALKRLHFYRSLEAKGYKRATYDGRDYFKGIELLDEFKK